MTMIPWLFDIIGSVIMLGGVMLVFKGLAKQELPQIIQGAVTSVIGGLWVSGLAQPAAEWIFKTVAGTGAGGDSSTAPTAKSSHGPDFSAGTLWWLLGSLGAAAVVAVAASVIITGRGRAAARREREVANRTRREAIEAEHDQVREEYARFVEDVLAVLDRPALADVSVSQTAAFLHAMDAAADAGRGEDLNTYRQAVSELKTAWQVADDHARRSGLRHFPEEERATISRARALLVKAEGNSSDHERRAAVAKARELLEGVVTIPRQAVAALETRHHLSLTKPEPTH